MTDKIYTRAEILANRRTWIDFQKVKSRKKLVGSLDAGNGHRCCLGHACYALKINQFKFPDDDTIHYGRYDFEMNEKLEKGEVDWKTHESTDDNSESSLPTYVMKMLGMYTTEGDIGYDENTDRFDHKPAKFKVHNIEHEFDSLVALNDDRMISASQIGHYLESVIEGGYGTPFKPLSDYPETI